MEVSKRKSYKDNNSFFSNNLVKQDEVYHIGKRKMSLKNRKVKKSKEVKMLSKMEKYQKVKVYKLVEIINDIESQVQSLTLEKYCDS